MSFAKTQSDISKYSWLLAVSAGGAWGLTLSILLVHWLVRGQPTYPFQSNPYVAFISDIAAFELKPVFITGCTISAMTYLSTIWSVNYIRYARSGYGLTRDARWRKVMSSMSVISSFTAAISLFLLAIFDTVHAHKRHHILLLCTFGGLGLSAMSTGATWCDRLKFHVDYPKLRRWCIVNTALVISMIALGVAFVALLYFGWWRTAGFLEWTISYLGVFWLLSFIGYLKLPEQRGVRETDERQPLLSAQSSS